MPRSESPNSRYARARDLALEVLFKRLSVNFFLLDRKGNFIGSNEKHWELLSLMHPSLNRAEILGQHSSQIFTPLAWENSRKVMETGQEKMCEETAPLSDGETVTFLSVKSPLFDSHSKKVIGMVGLSIDITQQKKLEENLVQAKKEAEAATKAKTEFLANMSHDIRTPLVGMVGLSEYLYDHIEEDNLKETAFQIRDLSQNLLEVSNSLIEGARSDSGNLPVTSGIFNIRDILTSIETLLTPAIQAKNLKFHIDYKKQMSGWWVGDEKRIRRILLNLVSNAVKFTQKGFISICIQARLDSDKKQGHLLEIKVQDSGPGIPENERKHIFERFVRLNPTHKGTYKGFGIGLSIVDQFIKELKGSIQIESEEGKGTTFICNIPVEKPNPDALRSFLAVKEPTISYETITLPRLKVLIVEDNPIASFNMRYQLEKLNFAVDWAENAQAAVQLYKKNRYNFVLSDLGLPDEDGVWVANKIRMNEKQIKTLPCVLVGLSAHLDAKLEKECLKAGMNEVMLKPLTQAKLINILEKHLLLEQFKNTQINSDPRVLNSRKVIDLQDSARRYYSNDQEAAERMLKRLIEILPPEKARMEAAFQKTDWDNLYLFVHNFYGGCLSCGVPQLTEALRLLQDALRKKDSSHIPALYTKVMEEIQKLNDAFKAMFGSSSE